MRLGLVARCRERGLGVLTAEFARHLNPAKTLVVARDEVDFVDHERFPGARWTRQPQRHNARRAIADGLPDDDLDWLLTDVDVVLTCETPYDMRLFDLARQRGVGTVLVGMYEYLPYRYDASLPRPDLFVAPSPWHLDEWPQPCEYLPVPVATDRFTVREVRSVCRVVHAAGAPAKGDRNGTAALFDALPHIRSDVEVVIRCQTRQRRPVAHGPAKLVFAPEARNYWEVFAGADAAVLPRRYGGLSLPLMEATAQGLPVIGLSRERSAGYDHAAVVPCTERPMGLPCGSVERADVDPRALARAIDLLVEDPEAAQAMSRCSAQVAAGASWEALRPRWLAVLGQVAR